MVVKKVILLMFFIFLLPKIQASIDPVSFLLLTPVAMEVVDESSQNDGIVVSSNMRRNYSAIGNFTDIFRLPFGLCQIIFCSPWGQLSPGMRNIAQGAMVPIRLICGTRLMIY